MRRALLVRIHSTNCSSVLGGRSRAARLSLSLDLAVLALCAHISSACTASQFFCRRTSQSAVHCGKQIDALQALSVCLAQLSATTSLALQGCAPLPPPGACARAWLVVASRWQRGGAPAMEEPQQSNDRVTAAPERMAPLARPTWVQGLVGDAPGGQAGEGAPAAAAKQAAAQLPCLDASHPRHCSMCDPAARSGVDAARQRARRAGLHMLAARLSHSSRVCRFADALRPPQRALRANMSWWATWAERTVRQPAAYFHFLSGATD